MYINPFVAGVLVTLLTELAVFFCYACTCASKSNDDNETK